MRLSIEVTSEQHQRLKAVSALRGQSIKDYVLERLFQTMPDAHQKESDEAMQKLEALLKPRLDEAEQVGMSEKSVAEIFEEAHQEAIR